MFVPNQLQAVTSADGRWKLQLPHTYRTLSGGPGGLGGKPSPYQQRKIESAELYDLLADPKETKNLAVDEPEVTDRLSELALAWRKALR